MPFQLRSVKLYKRLEQTKLSSHFPRNTCTKSLMLYLLESFLLSLSESYIENVSRDYAMSLYHVISRDYDISVYYVT